MLNFDERKEVFAEIHSYLRKNASEQSANLFQCEITLEIAKLFLSLSCGNRYVGNKDVQELTAAMKHGCFVPGNDAILITTDFKLGNGHHRFISQENAECELEYLIRTGVTPEELLSIDTGRKRSPTDAAYFNEDFGRIDKVDESIARVCMTDGWQTSQKCLGIFVITNWVKAHRSEIDFVRQECFNGRKISHITQASVLGTFVLAVNKNEDRLKLKYAGQVLLGGVVESRTGFETLSNLRSFLTGTKGTAGGSKRREVWQKTQNMLSAYLRGEERSNVTASKKSAFFCSDSVNLEPINLKSQELKRKLEIIARHLTHRQIVRPPQIAEMLNGIGYTANVKPSTLAKRFSDIVKNNGYTLQTRYGRITANISDDKSRIDTYTFYKQQEEVVSILDKIRKAV